MPERPDEEIDALLRDQLPSPPDSWVARAEELPRLERARDRLEELGAKPTEEAMSAALMHVGLEPDDERLRALARLRGLHARH